MQNKLQISFLIFLTFLFLSACGKQGPTNTVINNAPTPVGTLSLSGSGTGITGNTFVQQGTSSACTTTITASGTFSVCNDGWTSNRQYIPPYATVGISESNGIVTRVSYSYNSPIAGGSGSWSVSNASGVPGVTISFSTPYIAISTVTFNSVTLNGEALTNTTGALTLNGTL